MIAFYLVVASEIGCLSNDDHDGSAFFKLNRLYLDLLNLSNVGDFS